MRNQRGIATLEYLFAFILVGGFSFVLLALSLTLSTVEIVQYMTFASARAYYAGNTTSVAQAQAGQAKFEALSGDPVLAPFFKNGWFSLDRKTLAVGSVAKVNPDFASYRQDDADNLFYGTAIYLVANVLDFQVPFFGATTRISTGGKEGYGAYIGSYLGRETSYLECDNFMRLRFPAILKLGNTKNADTFQRANARYKFIPSDNGC